MALALDSSIKLASGHSIPRLGYGVYQARSTECENGVKDALKSGYRHIDSAQAYHNEDIVGRAVAASGVPRSEVFLTTKYMPSHQVIPASDVYSVIQKSLKRIDKFSSGEGNGGGDHENGSGGRYIDLMLIHAPFGGEQGRKNNWEALARAQKEGWIRDIGVSNFGVPHLKSLPSPKPSINQIELHPFCQQREIVTYCHAQGIAVQAYSPLIRADKDRYKNPVLVGIAEKYKKEVAQVLIRWSLQKGYIPLPKSVTPSRIKSNAEIYDFELDADDMKALDGLDEGAEGACTWNPVDQA